DLEVAVQHLRVDLHEAAERTADRVVHEDFRRAELLLDRRDRGIDLGLIRHVARKGVRVGNGLREIAEPLRVAREHGDGIAACRKAAHQRAAGGRADAGDDTNGLAHGQAAFFAEVSASATKSSRSLPKNWSSPTKMVGAPNTPRSAAFVVSS